VRVGLTAPLHLQRPWMMHGTVSGLTPDEWPFVRGGPGGRVGEGRYCTEKKKKPGVGPSTELFSLCTPSKPCATPWFLKPESSPVAAVARRPQRGEGAAGVCAQLPVKRDAGAGEPAHATGAADDVPVNIQLTDG